ncbi:hypothetical protein DPX16_3865 [Anabarilius grahami]|uniref:Uncharacterized protein n=1 Tax=Anabarilius grahami TaxID=495550 RepID=A0A3N0XU40_ANAGA|nr:hypothetical protein DPX16_3865 [Anabarilius grahami]
MTEGQTILKMDLAAVSLDLADYLMELLFEKGYIFTITVACDFPEPVSVIELPDPVSMSEFTKPVSVIELPDPVSMREFHEPRPKMAASPQPRPKMAAATPEPSAKMAAMSKSSPGSMEGLWLTDFWPEPNPAPVPCPGATPYPVPSPEATPYPVPSPEAASALCQHSPKKEINVS